MSVMVILVSFSILVAAGFLIAFLWAVKSGQFDDRHTPAIRMLFDDKKPGNNARSQTDESIIENKVEESSVRPAGQGSAETLEVENREEENHHVS